MIGLLRRGIRLAMANPALFRRRLAFLLRSPVRNSVALVGTSARSRRIRASYAAWLAGAALDHRVLPASGPLLSVLMPVYNPEPAHLEAAIRSVLRQTYEEWELCIADDASTDGRVRRILDSFARADPRVRVLYREASGHISRASNSALGEARGEFVVLLDHDDMLEPEALAEVARAVSLEPTLDLIYTDEDKIDPDGNRAEPFFKPSWSPTLLLSCNYITHLAALRRSLVTDLGGFRDSTVGSQDHDLFLRASERARAIGHIPLPLYSWRKTATSTAVASTAKPYAVEATRRSLEDAVHRRGIDAAVEPSHLNGIFRLRRPIARQPAVSVVVLGPGNGWRRILRLPGIEFRDLLYVLGSEDPDPRPLQNGPSVVHSVAEMRGDYLLWLDADHRPVSQESVAALVEHAQSESVAIVGGQTRDATGTFIRQAGLLLGDGGQPVYAFAGMSTLPQPTFYLNLKDLTREVSAVHVGSCLMRRDVWDELGGWEPALPPALAMADLCLRARAHGYNNVFTPLAQFRTARPLPVIPSVQGYDWTWRHAPDPFWNPNLTPTSEDGLPFWYGSGRDVRVRLQQRDRLQDGGSIVMGRP